MEFHKYECIEKLDKFFTKQKILKKSVLITGFSLNKTNIYKGNETKQKKENFYLKNKHLKSQISFKL